MIPWSWNIYSKQIHTLKKQISNCQVQPGSEKWEVMAAEYGISFWGDANSMESDSSDQYL